MITGINNQCRMAFRGEFIDDGELLNRSVASSSDYDLDKFGKTLERMAKVDDGRTYHLDRISYRNSMVNQQDIRLIFNDNNRKIDAVLVGRETVENRMPFRDSCYDSVIAKVNEFLTKIYPEPKTTNVLRASSLKKIGQFVTKA